MSDADTAGGAPHDEARRPSPDATLELPTVVLGAQQAQGAAPPKRRLIPGRVPLHWISWPMQASAGLSGALALRAVSEHGEWELLPVLIAWVTLAAWQWMYAMAWEYRRFVLRWSAIWASLLMQAVMALACLDRAPAQEVARRGVLISRDSVLEWRIAGILLIIAAALLLAHIVWFGRGWREAPRQAS